MPIMHFFSLLLQFQHNFLPVLALMQITQRYILCLHSWTLLGLTFYIYKGIYHFIIYIYLPLLHTYIYSFIDETTFPISLSLQRE